MTRNENLTRLRRRLAHSAEYLAPSIVAHIRAEIARFEAMDDQEYEAMIETLRASAVAALLKA